MDAYGQVVVNGKRVIGIHPWIRWRDAVVLGENFTEEVDPAGFHLLRDPFDARPFAAVRIAVLKAVGHLATGAREHKPPQYAHGFPVDVILLVLPGCAHRDRRDSAGT